MTFILKQGDVPNFLIPENLIINNSTGKILECVKELCCDEYFEYLKMIPTEYFKSIKSNDNILLRECLKNSSIIATEYIWEQTNKVINKSHLNYLLIKSIGLVKSEQTEFKYIDWLLNNDLIKKNDNDYSNLLNKCINTNNLKIFLII